VRRIVVGLELTCAREGKRTQKKAPLLEETSKEQKSEGGG
jgi:hypothetical protein